MRDLLKLSSLFVFIFVTSCAARFDELFRSPCSAPCWYDITPDVTTKDELIKLTPTFPYYQEQNVRWYDEQNHYSENIPESSGAFYMLIDDRWTSVNINFKNNLVTDIGFYSGIDILQQHIKLGPTLADIVDSYGEPNDMFISAGCGGDVSCRNLVLVYPDHGVLVAVESFDSSDNFRIEPTLPVVSMIYFQPPDYQNSLSSLPNFFSGKCDGIPPMLSWQGYTTVHYEDLFNGCR